MSTHVICPDCGARNAQGALWCGQCYRPLGEIDESPTAGDQVDTEHADDAQMQLHLSLPDEPRVGRGSWTCSVCGRANPLAESVCPTCGATIYDLFKETTPEPRSPGQALIRGLIVPGFGHVFARQTLLGVSVALLTLVGIVLGVVLMVQGLTLAGLALVLMGVGVWLAGALDAYRWARNEPDEIVLRPRVLTVIMAVMFIVLVAASISARGGQ
jgi:hypothetical protein